MYLQRLILVGFQEDKMNKKLTWRDKEDVSKELENNGWVDIHNSKGELLMTIETQYFEVVENLEEVANGD